MNDGMECVMKKHIGTEEEKKNYRRKRKQRNQMLAYGFTMLLLVVVCVMTVAGLRYMKKNQTQQESLKESSQAMVEDLFASEETIEAPTESETIPELTYEEKLDLYIEEIIGQMSLADKVAGLFFVTPEAITGVNTAVQAGEGTKTALEKYAVGGLIYFKKNIQSEDQITAMIRNSQEFARYPLFIGVDEEGGSVNRVAAAGLENAQPSAADIAATGSAERAYEAGTQIGTYLSELGFNINFAPVVDIANVEKSVMKDRAYGADAESAVPFVTAMMKGLHESGVTACLKHFPGIGSTTADTHEGLASTDRTAEELRSQEFTVFQAGIEDGAQMIMVGHVNVPALESENYPASMSRTILTDILRGELGYDGVIITDALNMSAVSEYYSSEQAAVMALKAGCDMLLMPEDFLQAYAGVLTAVTEGTISEQRINDSLKRIYRIKYAGTIE